MSEIRYSKQAFKALSILFKTHKKLHGRFVAAFDRIATGDISGLDIKSLTNAAGYRLRIGDYRAIYDNDGLILSVIKVDSRGDIYKT